MPGFVATFILGKVGFVIFGAISENGTDDFSEKSPKKVGKSPVLKTKSGQKKSEAFSENGTFWAIFAPFWPICANLKNFFAKKPTCPLLFLISCDKKF